MNDITVAHRSKTESVYIQSEGRTFAAHKYVGPNGVRITVYEVNNDGTQTQIEGEPAQFVLANVEFTI